MQAETKLSGQETGGQENGKHIWKEYFSVPHFSVSMTRLRSHLFDTGASVLYLLQHVLIGRALLVIDLDEFPSNLAFVIDHIRRWVRPAAFGLLVEQSVSVNHSMISV
jgi:hypothetical protein